MIKARAPRFEEANGEDVFSLPKDAAPAEQRRETGQEVLAPLTTSKAKEPLTSCALAPAPRRHRRNRLVKNSTFGCIPSDNVSRRDLDIGHIWHNRTMNQCDIRRSLRWLGGDLDRTSLKTPHILRPEGWRKPTGQRGRIQRSSPGLF